MLKKSQQFDMNNNIRYTGESYNQKSFALILCHIFFDMKIITTVIFNLPCF
jgi:hypothetical protein